MFQYDCPNCGSKVKLAQAAEPGQEVRCPVCRSAFVPRAETLGVIAEAPPARAGSKAARPAVKAAKPAAAKPAAARPAAAKAAAPVRPSVVEEDRSDLDNDTTPYG